MPSEDDSNRSLIDEFRAINWKREFLLIFIGSILGGIIFTSISPFVVPAIHNVQVNELGAQNPVLGIEVEYANDVSGNTFLENGTEKYDRYRIVIHNPSDKVLNTITVGVAFPGGIESQDVGHFQVKDGSSYSGNARLAQTREIENTTYVTNAIRISKLPPGKVVSATFLIDESPEEAPILGYWGSSGLDNYNASEGSIMVSGQFRWNLKGSTYTDDREFTLIYASQRASPYKFDLCVGEQRENICSS